MKVSLLNYIIMQPDEGKDGLILKSIELPKGQTVSPNRFVSAYGTKTTTAILGTARRQAIKDKKALYRVDLIIDGGDLPRGRIDLNVLPDIKFLNLERIQADLASAMMDILLQVKTSEDLSTPMKILADDPIRFELLWAHPDFKHISTFTWNSPMIFSGHKKLLKLAITRDTSLFESVEVRNFKNATGPVEVTFSS